MVLKIIKQPWGSCREITLTFLLTMSASQPELSSEELSPSDLGTLCSIRIMWGQGRGRGRVGAGRGRGRGGAGAGEGWGKGEAGEGRGRGEARGSRCSPPPPYRPSVDPLSTNNAADFQVPNMFFSWLYYIMTPFTAVFQYRRFSPVLRASELYKLYNSDHCL